MDKTELMKDVLKVTGIAPIIAYAEPEQAVPAAKALVAGGLPVVEVLMRNEHAMGNLERIARDVPEIVAGAGKFIIMPGIGRQVVEYCIDKKIPVIPNCITPGEMTMAVEYGLDMVKFFPIYQLGGLATLNEYTGAYPMLHFLVTGMLNETNFLPLLENRKVICGGDWMFTQGQALVNNDYALIARNLRESVYQAQDLRNRLAIRK